MNKSIFVYPWDIVDDGIAETLADIQSLGIAEINVSVSYHSGKFLLPHNPKKKIYYHEGGSVYFRPNLDRYGVLKPLPGKAHEEFLHKEGIPSGQEDLLSSIIAECRKLGLKVNAWVVGFHNTRLGRLHPEYTVRNVYGEPYYHALCPAHEECEHYVLQMIRDLVDQYDLDGIILESFDYLGCLHGDHHEIVGVSDKENLEKLLGLCLCPACELLAGKQGMDIAKFKSQLKASVEQVANLKCTEPPAPIEHIAEFLSMRAEVVHQIVRNVRQVVSQRNRAIRLYSILWLADGTDPAFYGTVPEHLSPYLDGWIACYPNSPEDAEAFIAKTKLLIPEEKLLAGLRLIAPQMTDIEQIPAYLESYKAVGVKKFHFYNYGLMPRSALDKIRDC